MQAILTEAGPTERRRYARQARMADTFFWPQSSPEATPHYARLIDLSPSGAGFATECPVGRGTMLVLLIMDAEGEATTPLTAEVRHARPLGRDGWVMGCQFTAELTASEWQALKARPEHRLPTYRNCGFAGRSVATS